MLLLSASRVSWSAMAFCAGCGGEALDTRAATVRCTGFGDNLHGISAGSSFQQRKDVISSRRIYTGIHLTARMVHVTWNNLLVSRLVAVVGNEQHEGRSVQCAVHVL